MNLFSRQQNISTMFLADTAYKYETLFFQDNG